MKTCLFDIDGTLILTGGAGQAAFAETFAEEFGVSKLTPGISFAGRSDRAIAIDFFTRHNISPSEENWTKFQVGYLPRLEQALAACDGRVLPGVLEVVRQLESRGDVLLGLLTGNVRSGAQRKLDYYGLWDLFADGDSVVGGFGDEHSDRNDIAATAAAEARRKHNAGPGTAGNERIVVIGDTPNDIRCGRSIGATVVAVPTGHHSAEELLDHRPDLLLETLEDASALVALFD